MNVAVRPAHLDMLSLCTGGGGLDIGIELAVPGARTVCMVEREAFAIAHLVAAMQQGLMAPCPVWSDARTFDGRQWRGCVDGLIGGIPCQPHSLAGRKRGSHDDRDLWSSARRIVVQARPWFVLIENVGGMLSPGDDEVAGAERVWRDLRKLGFAVEAGLFTAAEVGASHERERVFILGVADAGIGQLSIKGRRPQGRAGTRPASEVVSGVGLADAYSERLEGQRPDTGTQGRPDARGPSGLRDGTAMVDATRVGRREGRAEPELRSGRDTAASTSEPVGDTASARSHATALAGSDRGHEGGRPRDAQSERRGGAMADADLIELRREPSTRQLEVDERDASVGLFPPGPGDISGWRSVLARSPELEPAFRRVADGLASRLDIGRVDRLRMLGNGVVPLQAAHAFRTLATRLASRGSAGAARLVRMMEPA